MAEIGIVPTYGQKAVGLGFNPSGDSNVFKIKELYAQIIDLCNELRIQTKDYDGSDGDDSDSFRAREEKIRLLSVAITEAQTAQMWAVKGITWKF